MEKKIVKVPKYKQIKDGFAEKEVFVASDGKEFQAENQCQKYEEELEEHKKYLAIKKFSEYDGVDIDGEWFFAEDEEQLELIKKHNRFYGQGGRRTIRGDIKPQSWFLVRIIDGGDYSDTIRYISLDIVKEDWGNFISQFSQ